MFYVKKAEVYLVNLELPFQVNGNEAQNLYSLSLDRDQEETFPNFFISNADIGKSLFPAIRFIRSTFMKTKKRRTFTDKSARNGMK